MKILFVLCVLGFATAAFSAEEFDATIPADLASALIDAVGTGEIRFYTTAPDSFPELELPPELTIIGGMTHPNFFRVALSSELEMADAMAALLMSLQSAGYQIIPQHQETSRGFLVEETVPRFATVCHENTGNMSVRLLIRGDSHYFTLTGSSTPEIPSMDCTEKIAERQRFVDSQIARETMGARAYLPRLTIPEEQVDDYEGFQPPNRWSGSNTEYVTVSVIKTGFNAEELFKHFSGQLDAQKWTHESQSMGTTFHESEWIFINDDYQLISGKLHIEKQEKDNASLRFTLSTNGMFFIPQPGEPILRQGR